MMFVACALVVYAIALAGFGITGYFSEPLNNKTYHTKKRPWRQLVHNVSFDFGVTVFGQQIELKFIPFRWARPAFRNRADSYMESNIFDGHLYVGPFHLWSMSGLSDTLAFAFTISQDPFHGGKLQPRTRRTKSTSGETTPV